MDGFMLDRCMFNNIFVQIWCGTRMARSWQKLTGSGSQDPGTTGDFWYLILTGISQIDRCSVFFYKNFIESNFIPLIVNRIANGERCCQPFGSQLHSKTLCQSDNIVNCSKSTNILKITQLQKNQFYRLNLSKTLKLRY